MSGQLVYLRFEHLHTLLEVPAGFCQCLCVEAHAVAFHAGKYGHERHFQIGKNGGYLEFLHLLRQGEHEEQGYIGVLGSVVAHFFGRDIGHVLLSFSLGAYEAVDMDGGVAEVNFRQIVHVVPQLRLYNVVGQHRVEHGWAEFRAVACQNVEIVFEVLAHLDNFVAFVERPEYFNIF